MLHIRKRIKSDAQPHNAHDRHKQPAYRINVKIDRNILHQIEQCHLVLTTPCNKKREHRREHEHHRSDGMQFSAHLCAQLSVCFPGPAHSQMLPEGGGKQRNSGDCRQQYRKQNPRIHNVSLLCKHPQTVFQPVDDRL